MTSDVKFVLLLKLCCLLLVARTSGQLTEFSVWLCGYSQTSNELYRHPTDCHKYIRCRAGYPQVSQCPLGMYYVTSGRTCQWPAARWMIDRCDGSVEAYSNRICNQNIYATIPLPDTCALYLHCGHHHGNPAFYDRLLECSYPDLYDVQLQRCLPHQMVRCGQRPVPVAPCDYLQYKQTCAKPGTCSPCHSRHPSCRYHGDGLHPVRRHRNLFKVCADQRTLDVRKCLSGMQFDADFKDCVLVGGVSGQGSNNSWR